jgi:DNA mismatch repair protein MutS2
MIYPIHFEQKTGFDRIREEIHGACLGDAGRQRCLKMQFRTDALSINTLLGATDEFGRILISGKNFPSQDYYDLRETLKRLTIQGMIIEQEQLAELRASLRTLTAILAFFANDTNGTFPLLQQMIQPVFVEPDILRQTDRILDEKGDIRDKASETLYDIRRQLEQKKGSVEKKLRQVYLSLKKEGYTADEAEITIRNGRSVIPLPAANKRIIRGFIHDESATGQTIYIEPEEVFDSQDIGRFQRFFAPRN